MASWTLAEELRRLAATEDVGVALRELGLVEAGDVSARLETVQDWYRSGAETYALHFAVIATSGRRREYFMKACVAYEGGTPLEDIFAAWLLRRSVVESLGVGTPQLHAAGSALLVEEYVPCPLSEAFVRARDRSALLRALGSTVASLVNAGFAPLDAHDWRSRGDDVVLVDFGQDLGPPDVARGSESGLLSEVLDNLARDAVELSPSDLQFLSAVYEGLVPG